MRKLKAPLDCNEGIFGEQKFAVDEKGTITVPDDAVEHFLARGFELVKEEIPEAPKEAPKPAAELEGHQKMMHPDGTGASWGGKSYEPEDGVITVPHAAVNDLKSHGFEAV